VIGLDTDIDQADSSAGLGAVAGSAFGVEVAAVDVQAAMTYQMIVN